MVKRPTEEDSEADDLHISPFREDGVTYGTPTWIWSVAVDDALYVRGYNGKDSRWYKAAVRQKAGRIIAAGMSQEVTFEPVEGAINNRIDDAYRAKDHGSPYLGPMIGVRPLRDNQGHAALDQRMIIDKRGIQTWRSNEQARNPPPRVLQSGSQVQSGLIHYFRLPIPRWFKVPA